MNRSSVRDGARAELPTFTRDFIDDVDQRNGDGIRVRDLHIYEYLSVLRVNVEHIEPCNVSVGSAPT